MEGKIEKVTDKKCPKGHNLYAWGAENEAGDCSRCSQSEKDTIWKAAESKRLALAEATLAGLPAEQKRVQEGHEAYMRNVEDSVGYRKDWCRLVEAQTAAFERMATALEMLAAREKGG